MILRTRKPFTYAGRALLPGIDFDTKTDKHARILVRMGKAEYVDRTPGTLPPPPPGLVDRAATPTPQPHPLDHDGDGVPGGSPKPEDTGDLSALRAEYQSVVGKRPFHGWDEDQLRQKIAEHGN